MKPRERVLAALAHEQPDHVPTGENQIDGKVAERIMERPSLYNQGWDEMQALWDGRRDQIVADYCHAHVDLPRRLEWDYVRVPVVPPAREYTRPRMTGPYSWVDERGHEVTFNPQVGNIVIDRHFPDLSIDDLPDPDEPFGVDPSQLEVVRHVVREVGDTHFIVGRSPLDGTFPWELTVGMDEFLVRMVTDPEFVERATEVYVTRSIAYLQALLDAGVDAVMTTDDYSDNRGPLMGLERFRRFVLPGLIRQCEAVHEHGGFFIKHTDGNTWAILDEFADIGIDAWHGIQTGIGMDMRRLKQRYGDRLCLFGGVNTETLIEGPPERAREEVRYAIQHASKDGGLVITCSNVLQPGTHLENYLAARQAVRDFG